jgi:hypothetical protein
LPNALQIIVQRTAKSERDRIAADYLAFAAKDELILPGSQIKGALFAIYDPQSVSPPAFSSQKARPVVFAL